MKELEEISTILDQYSSIYDLALQDLGVPILTAGTIGMNTEQVLKAAIIKQVEGFSYKKQIFHLSDSKTYRIFFKFEHGQKCTETTLNGAIKAISVQTWEVINTILVNGAAAEDIKQG